MMPRTSSPPPLSRAPTVARASVLAALVLALAGCVEGTPFPSGRAPLAPATGPLAPQAERRADSSPIIADLQARRAVLPPEGPYAQIAAGVLAHSAGSAQAELRVKRLQAQAKSKNWLPQIGPSLSLTSLGDFAARLVLDQVLFDNGAKRAEREYAVADVELAAVALSQEMNDLVAEGIGYYLTAQQAREQAQLARRAEARLSDYDRIMHLRVQGGLSDMSEARVLAQKLAEMQATAAADEDSARTAMAQLAALSATPPDQIAGLQDLPLPAALPDALALRRAEGQRELSVAEARMARAGLLPQLGAQASVGQGKPDLGLTLGLDQMLGFGTGDQVAALRASEKAAEARVEKARNEAARQNAELSAKLSALIAKEARGRDVTAQTGQSLEMFARQYKLGRRTLMELVNMYESYAAMERAQAALKYDIARIKLEMARQHGILVDGSSI